MKTFNKKTSVFREKLKYISDNTYMVSKVFFILAIVALLCRTVCRLSAHFADFFVRYVASAVRLVMTSISNFLPFSLAEILVMLIPLIFVGIVICAVIFSKSKESTTRFIALLLSIVALIYFLFVFTYAAGFQTHTVDKVFDLKQEKVSVEELKDTADWLSETANSLADKGLISGKNSKMPFSWDELNEEINHAFGTVNSRYDFFCNCYTRTKPIILSNLMSYTHTLGVYTFFTGEASINTTYPDYTTVFTCAHEMAHQRGIARENEANFVAFIVCISSENKYIQYCGYLNMLEYVLNAIHDADFSLYCEIVTSLPPSILNEMLGYSEIYKKYDDTPVGDISQTINDTYLKSQGTEGTKSYGMVVDLAVAYYKSLKAVK